MNNRLNSIKKSLQKASKVFVYLLLLDYPYFSYANMPVIDVTAIGNMIMQYQQMIQEAMKYEKELAKLGVDTGRVGGILGKLDSMAAGTMEMLEAMKNLPNNIESLINTTKKECEFLIQDEKFKEKMKDNKKDRLVQRVTSTLKEHTACLATINNTKDMAEMTTQYFLEAQEALAKEQFDIYRTKMTQLRMLHDVQQKTNQNLSQESRKQWDIFYATYNTKTKEAEIEGYTKEHMQSRLESLLTQIKQANTQEDVQNFGNQVLLEILRMSQLNYEMMMTFNNTMVMMQNQDGKNTRVDSNETEYDVK